MGIVKSAATPTHISGVHRTWDVGTPKGRFEVEGRKLLSLGVTLAATHDAL